MDSALHLSERVTQDVIHRRAFAAFVLAAACVATGLANASEVNHDQLKRIVDRAVRPAMAHDAIPGMSVGLIVHGKPYAFNYGVASTATKRPVSDDTLFEVGSVSKTFTATLASLANLSGKLSLSDPVSKYLPSLKGRPFGDVTLVNLGTHTSGGLPLQVPDNVHNVDQLMRYLNDWRPTYAPGTYRTYSNISIGLLGLITAKSFDENFDVLMEQQLLPALGLKHTYINVPSSKMVDYAEGYRDGSPIRVAPGVLSSEAYGIKTTAPDMIRFIEANMNMLALQPKVQRAITGTHIGYFKAGVFTQDLIWEQYAYPVALTTLLTGNSTTMLLHPYPATAIAPPEPPREDVWINKTGTTNGFGAYVAFVPELRCGVVLLANKNYPIVDRVTLAYGILRSACGYTR